jgi:hypothetical protein
MQEGMRSRGMMGGQDQVCSWNVADNPGPFPEEGACVPPNLSLGD